MKREKNQIFITYTGTVEFVTETKEETNKKGNPYFIRAIAVNIDDVNPDYPVTLVFDVLGNDKNMKKINMLDGISKGEDIAVTFTVNSKPYTNAKGENKYFLTLNLISLESEGQDTGMPDISQEPEGDDLPF